ncbi:CAS1 domain-containing protein 1 [Stylophora pistillata]|uniref:CAS1 domain-containing protein 1 n=1 Tax=Stylophora pistillata TaxID=50429 RepID=A0A2B4RX51_STYPI|nr:CAS1 domain-containing protein 1 [Stylophora pistillata]
MNVVKAGNFTEGRGRLPSKGSPSIHQKALFVFWLSAVSLAAFRKLLLFFKVRDIHTFRLIASDDKDIHLGRAENGEVPQQVVQSKEYHDAVQENGPGGKLATPAFGSSRPSLDNFLYSVAVFGLIMFFYHLCDDEHYFPATERTYSRDLFWFLVLLIFAVSVGLTRKETTDKILNREQTEEWKGWMQVMFVWYHYFKAAETYNAIRVFIAAYVWMTGFGKLMTPFIQPHSLRISNIYVFET